MKHMDTKRKKTERFLYQSVDSSLVKIYNGWVAFISATVQYKRNNL